jgi:transposase
MRGFIVGADRNQATLFPESLDDYVAEESAVRLIDFIVDELDLLSLGFKTLPADTGRPGYHPATMLKLSIYGYMNRVASGHRLEMEARRNIELMWLTQRLAEKIEILKGEIEKLKKHEAAMLAAPDEQIALHSARFLTRRRTSAKACFAGFLFPSRTLVELCVSIFSKASDS